MACYIPRRSHVALLRQAEISDFGPVLGVDKNVCTLEVAVDDLRIGSVQEAKTLSNVLQDWKEQVSVDRNSLVVENVIK